MAAQALTGIRITDHRSLNANTCEPDNRITHVTFCASGVALGEFTAPACSLVRSNVPVGIYSVSARAIRSGFTTNLDTAIVLVDNGGAPAPTLTPLGQGSNAITGQDLLGPPARSHG